jgi:hypothetical protein
MSSVRRVRPSIRPSVRPSVRYFSAGIAPTESWKFAYKSGIWDRWPRSPGFRPYPGPSPKNIRYSEHNLSSCYQNWNFPSHGLLRKISAPGMFFVLDQWSSAPVAYSPIRPKSQIFNIGHDYALWIRNFMVMMKNPRTSILRLSPMSHGHNPAKVPKFKYKTWWYSINRKFPADDK